MRCMVGLLLVLVAFSSCDRSSIQEGYTDRITYFPGETGYLLLNAKDQGQATLSLYNLRQEAVAECLVSYSDQVNLTDRPWREGFGYDTAGSFQVPEVPPGLYHWQFGEVQIPIVIADRSVHACTVVLPINTWMAYNSAGGKSLYGSTIPGDTLPADMVSFQRSWSPDQYSRGFLTWSAEHLSDANYITDVELENETLFASSEVLVIAGHSEYWTRKMRENIDRFVATGGHLVVLSGNTMWWQCRYENDGLVCYRDWERDPISDSALKTVEFDDPRLNYPIINTLGADFRHGGYGNRIDPGWDGYRITQSGSPLLEGTELEQGDILILPTSEYDGAPLLTEVDQGPPQIDTSVLNPYRFEIIGYDIGSYSGRETVGTFVVYQRDSTSGVVVNVGSSDWCSIENMIEGPSAFVIQQITANAIRLLMDGEEVFRQKSMSDGSEEPAG